MQRASGAPSWARLSGLFLLTGLPLAVGLWPSDGAWAIDPGLIVRELVVEGEEWEYLAPQSPAQDPFNATNVSFEDWASPDYDTSVPLTLSGGGSISWRGPALAPFHYGGVTGLAGGTELNVPTSGNRFTHYFRRTFTLDEAANGQLEIQIIVDDGAVGYLDGVEFFRFNCCLPDFPGELPLFTDFADSTGAEGFIWLVDAQVPEGVTLDAGEHVLAIEVHQANATSSDLGLDLTLLQNGPGLVWKNTGSGDWADFDNWLLFARPDDTNEIAVFGNTITAPSSVWLDASNAIRGLEFDSDHSYALAGLGTLIFDSDTGSSNLDVLRGDHQIQTVVQLDNDTVVTTLADSSLEFNNDVFLNGHTLSIGGEGEVRLNNLVDTGGGSIQSSAAVMTGSTSIRGSLSVTHGALRPGDGVGLFTISEDLILSTDSVLQMEIRSSAQDQFDQLLVGGETWLDGTLELTALDADALRPGDTFQLIETRAIHGTFSSLRLPAVAGLTWDTSQLYTQGVISIVPEPAGWLLFACGGLSLMRRRRERPTCFVDRI
ncbi:MAG: hypothetical protein KDA60_07075 [Planctomycetales bacterium]|nr:hypothetical protein [Planctomycetales bacterium]